MQYIDCGAAFLVNDPARPGGRILDVRLVPDGVHPSAAGMDVLGLCLDPTVAYLKSHPRAGVRKKDVIQVPTDVKTDRQSGTSCSAPQAGGSGFVEVWRICSVGGYGR